MGGEDPWLIKTTPTAYQLEIDFSLLVGQFVLFIMLLAFEAIFEVYLSPILLKRGWIKNKKDPRIQRKIGRAIYRKNRNHYS